MVMAAKAIASFALIRMGRYSILGTAGWALTILGCTEVGSISGYTIAGLTAASLMLLCGIVISTGALLLPCTLARSRPSLIY